MLDIRVRKLQYLLDSIISIVWGLNVSVPILESELAPMDGCGAGEEQTKQQSLLKDTFKI